MVSFPNFYRAAAVSHRIFLWALVYPSIWVAAAIASLVPFVQYTLDLAFDWAPVLLIFATALIPYNVDRIADSYFQEIPDPQAQSYFRGGWGWVILSLAVMATVVLLYCANQQVVMVSLAGLIPFIYGLPIFPWRRSDRWQWFRLKDVPATKAWIVTSVITYAVIAVPLASANQPFTLSTGITSLFLLIFVGTNSHLFDIRDLQSDKKAGVQTLPGLVGITGNRRIWFVLNGLAFAVVAWGWSQSLLVPASAIALPCIAVNLIALGLVKPTTPRSVYSILIDGYLFLPGAIVGVFR
ncbi:prenyltransferase [Leptolyngbya sp. CCNP1308]|uniref:prenyltransferase n=1 Tax=Leptolyngbya sp. CCNP1308 TaxID=3110255 RepID=UPI002B2055EF|nr:prenyltransferase [Leptolyngbya sp. CCNP1308]MEA5449694.1 prenyltransferase [Leptolyngbya sp. CCNP1308]